MSTFLTDKCNDIRGWLAIGSDIYSDSVVTEWIRMAEEQLSTMLRVKHMVQIDTSVLTSTDIAGNTARVAMPLDWQELRFVRTLDASGNGSTTLRYTPVDEFYNPEWPNTPQVPVAPYQNNRIMQYTILGNYIVIGGTNLSPGITVELTYYQNIPPLTDDTNSWLNYYHPSIFTLKTLHVASLYAIEDARGPIWAQQVGALASAMNAQHMVDRASGSVLPLTRKTFG